MAQRFKAKTLISNSGVFNNEVIAPNLVYNTGDQIISGVKNFYTRPTVNGSGFVLDGETFPNIEVQDLVLKSGNQTISGIKTFTTGIIAPNVVYNTGNQTVSGLKTFSNGIVSSVGITGTNIVYNTGNQTIGGLKTFSNGVISSVGITGTNLVYNTGDQNINGIKNFILKPTVNSNEIFVYGDYLIDIRDEGSSLGNVNTINFIGPGVTTSVNNGNASVTINGGEGAGTFVSLVGNETIAGVKTFTNGIVSSVGITGTNIVYNTGSQTIGGRKTFSNGVISSVGITGTNIVYNTGDQTIGGLKTFSNGVISSVGITGTNLVYNTGDETIGGLKTFSDGVISSVGITGTNLVYNTGDQNISGLKIFADGINLSGSALENAVPKIVDIIYNFDITSGIYNTKIIFADLASTITGTITGDNPSGFNTTIIQYGAGPIKITGAPGITINSYQNKYQSAGQYAAISIIQKSTNNYFIFGNTV